MCTNQMASSCYSSKLKGSLLLTCFKYCSLKSLLTAAVAISSFLSPLSSLNMFLSYIAISKSFSKETGLISCRRCFFFKEFTVVMSKLLTATVGVRGRRQAGD